MLNYDLPGRFLDDATVFFFSSLFVLSFLSSFSLLSLFLSSFSLFSLLSFLHLFFVRLLTLSYTSLVSSVSLFLRLPTLPLLCFFCVVTLFGGLFFWFGLQTTTTKVTQILQKSKVVGVSFGVGLGDNKNNTILKSRPPHSIEESTTTTISSHNSFFRFS